MRIYRGILPFAIIASRSAQGLPPSTSGTPDRTTLTNPSLPQNQTSHGSDRETRDTHMYTCLNGACTYSASSGAQTKPRVPLPLMLAGAGLATILGAHALAIPLAIVAFSDSTTAEPIPPPRSKTPTPDILEISITLPPPSHNDKDDFSVYVPPTSLPTLSLTPIPNHDLSTRAAGAVAGGPCAPMNALACTGDYFLVCSHSGTWTNTGSMGSNYVCEDGVPASTQCEDDPSSGTSGQTGAGAGAGASSNTGAAHSAAPRARSGSRPVKLLLSAALAAALNGYVIALPVALFGLLQPATAALTSSLVPLSQLPPTVSASPLLPAAPVGPQKLTIRTSCSNNGALSCGDGGNSFFLCSEGTLVDMGHVAAGTVCVDGGIVAAAGGAGAGAGAGAGIDSGAVGRSVGLGLLAGGLAISALGAPMAAVLDGICGD